MTRATSAITEIPPQIQKAFSLFCKERDWTEAEVLTLLMLKAIETGDDLVIPIVRQRARRRERKTWFDKFSYLESYL